VKTSQTLWTCCICLVVFVGSARAADWSALDLPRLPMPDWQLPSWQTPGWQLPQFDLGWNRLAKGNDTGGIIPWSPDTELQARGLADAFCGTYGKYGRITGVHRQYGDYISFNCLWDPSAARFALPEVRVGGSGGSRRLR
jgi:hypothetical protein